MQRQFFWFRESHLHMLAEDSQHIFISIDLGVLKPERQFPCRDNRRRALLQTPLRTVQLVFKAICRPSSSHPVLSFQHLPPHKILGNAGSKNVCDQDNGNDSGNEMRRVNFFQPRINLFQCASLLYAVLSTVT